MYCVEISSYDDRTPTTVNTFTFPQSETIYDDEPLMLVSSHQINVYSVDNGYQTEIVEGGA